MENLKKVGRPLGRRKTSKIEICLEPEVKNQFMTYLKDEGKSASIEVGFWINEYIKERNSKYHSINGGNKDE